MNETRYIWDEAKNRSNQKKHGISFEEAAQIFLDPFYISIHDRVVDGEMRWQTFGMVRGHLILMVAHTLTDPDAQEEIVRIISARKSTKPERRHYENENG